MNEFFDEHQNTLELFLKKIKTQKILDLKLENRKLIQSVIEEMINRDSILDESFSLCTFNIRHIGMHFINTISHDEIEKKWSKIVVQCLRFCKELEVNTAAHIESVHNLLVKYSKENYEDEDKQIYYVFNIMPFKVVEEKNLEKYKEFKSNLTSEVDELIEKSLPNKKKEIQDLKSDSDKYVKLLDGFKQKFSFLALNQAFNGLEEKKQKQLGFLILSLIGLGSLIVILPMAFYIINKGVTQDIINSLVSAIPLVFVESLFIYYFRICLNKYNSISDQIVQLETKQAIMQFIESYVDYKKDKDLKPEEMNKFEEIVFAQISPNLKDIPSSPDIISIINGITKSAKRK